ncbi:MAG: hypothetical protein JWM57_2761 [Phycisphaerales bacterium]|nr:hypothetical protein [Phycisphaerales bacterium]
MLAASIAKIGDVLGYLATDFAKRPQAHQSRSAYRNVPYTLAKAQPNGVMVRTVNDTVLVKAIANAKGGKKLAAQLESIGATVTGMYGVMVSAAVPVSVMAKVAALSTLNYADAEYGPVNSVGRTEDYGEQSMNSDRARHDYAVDGTGVTVGVISDSYGKKSAPFTTPAQDIANGDLPASPNVVKDYTGTGTDEGRAMMQIVHDVAPGANEAFYTADVSEADFAAGIITLAKPVASGGAGAKVVVDDVFYFDEPYFQDGVVAQAVDTVYNTYGTSYFSSAGNFARSSYESNFSAVSATPAVLGAGVYHDFDPSAATSVYQQITIPSGSTVRLSMQWDAPYASASSNAGGSASPTNSVGLYLMNSAQTALLTSSTTSRVGGDAYQLLGYTNSTGAAITAYVAIKTLAGANPGYIKYNCYNATINTFATNSPASFGHSNATHAVGVGAAEYTSTPAFGVSPAVKESFTSAGGTGFRFNANGTPKAVPEVRAQPSVTGPDGAATSFFSSQLIYDAQFHFYGTSAAAPHVAAVAALMLQSRPALSNAQIYSTLQSTASDMGPAGFDAETGYGFVQADKALAAVSGSNISGNVYRDLNKNGIKDGSDTNVVGQSVFFDSNNNGLLDSGSGTVSGTPSLAIPDAAATYSIPSRVSTSLNTNYGGRVTGVTVSLTATHPFASDLGFTLITPSGVRIPLMTVVGNYQGGGTGYNLTFSDAAATSVQSAISAGVLSGTYKPQSKLSTAIGENATGTWQLEGRDYLLNNVGTLNSWSLTLNYADTSIATDGSGNYNFAGVAPSTYFGTYCVRTAALAGFTTTSATDLNVGVFTAYAGTNFAFVQTPLTIASVVLDDGTAQRSMIRSVTLTFNGIVTTVGALAVGVAGTAGTSGTYLAQPGAITSPAAGQTQVKFTWSGAGLSSTSLPDGRYNLTINGNLITDSTGQKLDAANNGTAGSTRSVALHRLYADIDGNAVVNFNDFLGLQNAYNTTAGTPAFVSGFDSNSDNVIDFNDFLALQNNFNKTI